MESLRDQRGATPFGVLIALILILLACGESSEAPAPAVENPEDEEIPTIEVEAYTGRKLDDEIFRVLRNIVEAKEGADDRKDIEKRLVAILDEDKRGDAAMRRAAVGALVGEILRQAERFRPPGGGPGLIGENQKIFVEARAQILGDRLRDALDPERARDAALAEGRHLDHALRVLDAPNLADLEIPKGYEATSWRRIGGFSFEPGMKLPAEVLALDGKKVAMAGYVMSLGEFEDLHEFTLVESAWACCFGIPPEVHQSLTVTIPDDERGIDLVTTPVLVTGRLKIEEVRDDEYVVGLYAVRADDVVEVY